MTKNYLIVREDRYGESLVEEVSVVISKKKIRIASRDCTLIDNGNGVKLTLGHDGKKLELDYAELGDLLTMLKVLEMESSESGSRLQDLGRVYLDTGKKV